MTINFAVWLGIALIASIAANIFMFWYVRRLLAKLWFVAENIGDLVDLITNYEAHLKTLFELEQYYGDENIKFVLSHTASLIEVLEEYEDIYNIVEEAEEQEQKEEIEQDAEKTIQEENVFYAGPRGRNNKIFQN
jgi:ABC-type multidrug transport system fused ATPase/permease subunit